MFEMYFNYLKMFLKSLIFQRVSELYFKTHKKNISSELMMYEIFLHIIDNFCKYVKCFYGLVNKKYFTKKYLMSLN